MTDFCNVDIASPLYVPLITNKKGMDQAVLCLENVLLRLGDSLQDIADSADKKGEMEHFYLAEINRCFGIGKDDTELTPENVLMTKDEVFGTADMYYSLLTARFTSAPYLNTIKGDLKRSVNEMRKVKELFGYERRMIRLWEEGTAPSCTELSEIVENADAYNSRGVQSSGKEFLALFFSWFVLTACLAPLFAGLFLLVMHTEARESVYLMGVLWNLPFAFVFAFITSIPLSYFTRFTFYKLFYKKDFERYREMDHITNGKSSDKVIKAFLIILVVLGFIMMLLFVRWNLNFYEDGFVDNSRFFSLKGEYYRYDEIDRLYYLPNRTNDFGDVLDYPSYVIVLTSGREIDLYEFDTIENYENKLLPFLKKKDVEVTDKE